MVIFGRTTNHIVHIYMFCVLCAITICLCSGTEHRLFALENATIKICIHVNVGHTYNTCIHTNDTLF